MSEMGRLLYRLARARLSRLFIRWVFTYMSFAIPVKRLRETETLLAFHHPQPSHPVHILLVPKRPFSTLLGVPPGDIDFLHDQDVEPTEKDDGRARNLPTGGNYANSLTW